MFDTTSTLIAHFKIVPVPSKFDLTVNVVPSGSGKVNLNEFLINVYPYTTLIDSNDLVMADAVSLNGFQFVNWTINNHSLNPGINTPSVSFIINEHDTLTAYFETMPEEIRPNPLIFVPNSFTPNNDPVNGSFRIIYNEDVISGEYSIFDRWGLRIFSSMDLNIGWDGTMNGVEVQQGVYNYTVRYKYLPAGSGIKSGSILLIR